jgi:acyl carrier protein
MNSIPLKRLMADVFECAVDDIDADARINETVGWDSLSHINLMLELGKHGIAISPLQIPQLTSYAAIHQYIGVAGLAVDE